jgi:molybdate transport system substrate-binding protein
MVSSKVTVIPIPDSLNVVAEYPIAVLTRSGSKAAAGRFVALVTSERGQAVLARHGFQPVR